LQTKIIKYLGLSNICLVYIKKKPQGSQLPWGTNQKHTICEGHNASPCLADMRLFAEDFEVFLIKTKTLWDMDIDAESIGHVSDSICYDSVLIHA